MFTVGVLSEEGGPVRNICPASLSMLLWQGSVVGSRPSSDVSDCCVCCVSRTGVTPVPSNVIYVFVFRSIRNHSKMLCYIQCNI